MAINDALLQDDPKKKPLGAQDPLFYEGKTPVLGADVSVQEPTGELAFPEAGASPTPAPAGAGPDRPTLPPVPEFNHERPMWNFTPPEAPKIPEVDIGPSEPWWSTALTGAQTAEKLALGGKKLYDMAPAPTGFDFPELGTQPGLGFDPAMLDVEGINAMFPPTGAPSSLGGPAVSSPEALAPGAAPTITPGFMNTGLPIINAGLGAYNVFNAINSGNEGAAAQGAMQTATAGAAAIGSLIGSEALQAFGPVGFALSLPALSGQIYERYFRGDTPHFPDGYTYIPGSGNDRGVGGYAVNPATGVIMQYKGKGKYGLSEMTQNRQLPTPDQFRQWGIEPTGKLAQHPLYAGVPKQMRDEDIASAGQFHPGTTSPIIPSEAHQRAYLENWRQPYIDQIRAQHPNDPDSRIWWYYTQTPWYQQELNMSAGWNQGAGFHGTGEHGEPSGSDR